MDKKTLRIHVALVAGLAAGAWLATAVAAPVAAAPAAPTAAAAAAPAGKVAAGEEIAFDDLPAYVGAEVIVSTRHGTVRRAVLTGASSISINLELVAAEGGFAMSMGREVVAKVVLAAATAAKD